MKLTNAQLKTLSSIASDAGQVFFASVVVPFIFDIERIALWVLIAGLSLTVACWITSVIIIRGVK